jgi:hypothetical protein
MRILAEVYLVIALGAAAFSTCEDYFRVVYEFLSHDKIQARISKPTAFVFREYGTKQPTSMFSTYLVQAFADMPQCDETGAFGSITNSDYNETAHFIIDGFDYFQFLVGQMEGDQELEYLYVMLRRSWTWSNFNPREAMSFKNQLSTEC